MENRITIPLGDYVILNTVVSLHLTIDFYNMIDNYHNPGVKMFIPIPNNYPPTALLNDNNPLFYAILTVSSVDTPTYDWFISSVSDDYYDEDIQDVVMVREFYIKAKEHHIPLTNDEVIYTKGLGKRCLCLAMPYVIDYFNIQTDTAAIALTASGGIGLYNYYIKTYGFSPLYNTKTDNTMFMVADLYTFLDHCH